LITLRIDAHEPDPHGIEQAARIIRDGGIVAMPTDTLYGLAGDPFNTAAVARIFAIKRRGAERALPLVAADVDQITAAFGPLSPLAQLLATRFWPGPLTLLVPASGELAPDVTGGTGRVGVRVPAHAVTRALCRAAAVPITATSANVSGRPATDDPDEVAMALGDAIDLLLDAGKTAGGPPSTIVDVTEPAPRVIRAGAIPWETIQRCLGL
jgi:L-threonylcarbamoyladenylate synthase